MPPSDEDWKAWLERVKAVDNDQLGVMGVLRDVENELHLIYMNAKIGLNLLPENADNQTTKDRLSEVKARAGLALFKLCGPRPGVPS